MLNNSQLHHQLFLFYLGHAKEKAGSCFLHQGSLITFMVLFHSYLFSPSRRRAGGFWWIHDNSWAQTSVIRRSWWFPWKYDRQHLLAGKWGVHVRFSLAVMCFLGRMNFDYTVLSVSSDWSELSWTGMIGALWIRCLCWSLCHAQCLEKWAVYSHLFFGAERVCICESEILPYPTHEGLCSGILRRGSRLLLSMKNPTLSYTPESSLFRGSRETEACCPFG